MSCFFSFNISCLEAAVHILYNIMNVQTVGGRSDLVPAFLVSKITNESSVQLYYTQFWLLQVFLKEENILLMLKLYTLFLFPYVIFHLTSQTL